MADSQVVSSVTNEDDFSEDAPGVQARWTSEIELAEKELKAWSERCDKIVTRYRDDRSSDSDSSRRLNVLWSTVATEIPAVYQHAPKPEVGRRFKTKNAITRTAAAILERYLQVDLERDKIDGVVPRVLLDRLLCSRGQVWVEYDPIVKGIPTPISLTQQPDGSHTDTSGEPYEGDVQHETGVPMGTKEYERIVDCRAPVRYVFWKDFLHSPSRAWEEVRWVARLHRYTQAEVEKKFATGQKMFKWVRDDIKLTENATLTDEASERAGDLFKRAVVYEIWDDEKGQIVFISKGMRTPLEVRTQPYRLESRFPCPEPLYGTLTNESLIPIPDFVQWQDLADEIDDLTERIAMLTKAVRVVGAYDSSASTLSRMLTETGDNEMIPVENWAAFNEKGGLAGSVAFMPLDAVISAIETLGAQRQERLDLLSQISGVGELLRGQGDIRASATHDTITQNFGSLRLKEKQADLGRFVAAALQIKAEIIAEKAPPEVMLAISSIGETRDAVYAQQAVQMLKDERTRDFKIEVEEASMVQLDEEADKAARNELVATLTPYLQGMIGMPPPLLAVAAEVLMFQVRGNRVGRDLEGAIEQYVEQVTQAAAQPQQPQVDPKVQAVQAKHQGDMELEQARHADRMQELQAEAQKDTTISQVENDGELQQAAIKAQATSNDVRVKAAAQANDTARQAQADRARAAQEHGQNVGASLVDHALAMREKAADHFSAMKQIKATSRPTNGA